MSTALLEPAVEAQTTAADWVVLDPGPESQTLRLLTAPAGDLVELDAPGDVELMNYTGRLETL